jgi:hypothetical protein
MKVSKDLAANSSFESRPRNTDCGAIHALKNQWGQMPPLIKLVDELI